MSNEWQTGETLLVSSDSFRVSICRVAALCYYSPPRCDGIHNHPRADIKTVGILGYDSDDDLALLEDGSHHPELYFILIDRDRFRVDATGLVVYSGLVFQDGGLFFVEFPAGLRIDYLVNYNEDPLQGRSLTIPVTVQSWVRGYPFSKDLTSDVLRRAGLLVPRDMSLVLTRTLADGSEILLNQGHNPRMDARRVATSTVVALNLETLAIRPPRGLLAAFLAEYGCEQGVIKPNRGGRGDGVHFFGVRNLVEKEAELSALLRRGCDVMIQERVVPPLITTGSSRLDWNLRVFVTRDRHGQPVVPDMIACIGEEGSVINTSLDATTLLLEEIAQLLAWDDTTLAQVRGEVSAVSAHAYRAMCEAIAADAASHAGPSAPDILGLDVIVRRRGTDWQVYVIEMDINPGGAWELNHRLRTLSRTAPGRGDLSKEALDARIGGANHAWIRLIGDRCYGSAACRDYDIAATRTS
jgi:hypothetical protein